VYRSDKTQRGVLNAPIFKDMKYALENDKHIRFQSLALDGVMTIQLLKFRNGADATECKQAIDKCVTLVSA